MSRNVDSSSFPEIQTTVGELVEIITEIAFEAGKTEDECYHLAALTIENILKRNKKEISLELN